MSGVRTALKEWAVLANALGRGDIVALIRKGGIREQRAGFSVRHERFLIYPTYFHEKEAELAERFRADLGQAHEARPKGAVVRIALHAEAVAVWRVTELERLRPIGGAHGLAWGAVEARFRYRDRPWVHVAAVRISRLATPVEIPETRRYQGCVSWVTLDADVDVGGALPVLPTAELDRRIAELGDALGDPSEVGE